MTKLEFQQELASALGLNNTYIRNVHMYVEKNDRIEETMYFVGKWHLPIDSLFGETHVQSGRGLRAVYTNSECERVVSCCCDQCQNYKQSSF
jgi:hypothetical protein